MEIFLNIVERLGFPAAMLVVIGLAVWRIIVWTGNRIIIPVTDSHIALVEEAKEANKANTATLVTMAEAAKVTGTAIVRIADQHEEGLKLTREIHQQLVKKVRVENELIRSENTAIRIENTAIRNENQGEHK